MRTRRPTAPLVLGLLAAAALTGCRTEPSVAAYVGDEQITVAELEAAVQAHRDTEGVTAGEGADYTRQVLTGLVRAEVYTAAAEQWGVSVDTGELAGLLPGLIEGQDPDAFLEQRAAQGFTRDDVLEQVRQLRILQEIAEAEGLAPEPTEEELQSRYDAARGQLPAEVELGYVLTPDQAVADQVRADLTADPAAYPAVAAQFVSEVTLAEIELVAREDVPPPLADQVAASPAGTVFTTQVEGIPGVFVVVVGDTVVPSFEEVRPLIESAVLSEAVTAAQPVVQEFEDGLDITVNPRFGTLDEEGGVVAGEGGVVQILGTDPSGARAAD
ncbi:peptidyl-prolyl cis-trans isomerase [Blastococcus sp. SYSU D00820]